MSNAYLVDVGVVVDKDEYPACYSNVYDEARGYYDEDRYLVDDLEKAKKEALQYVADGVDKTYTSMRTVISVVMASSPLS